MSDPQRNPADPTAEIERHLKVQGHECYPIGRIVAASDQHPSQTVVYHGQLDWS